MSLIIFFDFSLSLAAQEFVSNMRHFVQSSDVPSDFNLASFSLWFSLSEAEERREAESLYVLVHRPVQSSPEFG